MFRNPTIGAVAVTAAALLAAGCGTAEGSAAAAGSACPADTSAVGSACVETASRPDRLTWRESNLICLSEGRRLPALAELQTFLRTAGATGDQQVLEWHNLRYRAGTDELGGLVNGAGDVPVIAASEPQAYRCVAPIGPS